MTSDDEPSSLKAFYVLSLAKSTAEKAPLQLDSAD